MPYIGAASCGHPLVTTRISGSASRWTSETELERELIQLESPSVERKHEARLLRQEPDTVQRGVVRLPAVGCLCEDSFVRELGENTELVDVEAVVDRLGEIRRRRRVEAVLRPPA